MYALYASLVATLLLETLLVRSALLARLSLLLVPPPTPALIAGLERLLLLDPPIAALVHLERELF